MAQDFIPSNKYPSDFNGGKRYKKGDAVQAKTINDLIESALWVQELAFEGGGGTGSLKATYDPFKRELRIIGLNIIETTE
jgi:hypothetical protein